MILFIRKPICCLFALLLFLLPLTTAADVVKPALIEIVVNEKGQVNIEIRASIEALLTGIDGRYKNTQDAPNADEYDVLRKMESGELLAEFEGFKRPFLEKLSLLDDKQRKVSLNIKNVKIPEPGYTKVPRISLIELSGLLSSSANSLTWYYPASFGDNAVRLKQVNEAKQEYHWSQWQWLKNDKPSEAMSLTEIVAEKPLYQTIFSYIVIGFEHILPKGLDHILFILGLFLFGTAFKPLVLQITMFTLAHTLTLGLAMNGVINLPANIVEPLIALSIAYVGIENVFAKRLNNSRLVLVFLFGLLHGLGFASVLSDFGMPENAFVTALISFNIGVEIGQLTIILAAFLLIGLWFSKKRWYKSLITTPASLATAVVAFYWFIERLDLNYFI
ncbi:HupE/UreJ family protein [Cocleimonas sp. KMM 6892]|uniref:HupE/UreJ family protein n=1 Tax=unclassified Cocleimonas TaxID=2639732 RepID=UPI002DB65581|nr:MULTISPECIES: HupE/UreJ family protein [unclassified Cocleimonas]MEB8431676.1 HupE/UreJ family protein [Cocleimonas sp. KMM 6892]MEC4713552.1 HupE/UreJ family protein [Cocleimonas sp. KMM 6895]MEC4742883.1 HupE/UreJ family protein [Cocleimonas sp. KMM 6896]